MVKFSWSLAIKLFLHLISDLWRGNKCIAFFLYLYPVEQCTMFFFSIRVFFHGYWQLTVHRGREGTFFYAYLPLPPAHEHSGIYLQLCTWDDYHIFLIATLVFTRLLLDEIYRLIELLFNWLMMWCWFSFVCLLIWF